MGTIVSELKGNETIQWATNLFIKVGLIGFIVLAIILIAKAALGFTFDFNASLGV